MDDSYLSKIANSIEDYIYTSDRKRFNNVLKYIFSRRELIFSVPELYKKDTSDNSQYYPSKLGGIQSYTFSPVKKLAEDMELEINKKFTKLTYLKEVEEDKEYAIYVLSRSLVTIQQIPAISKKYEIKTIPHNTLTYINVKFNNLSPEIELIDVYHKLYQPIDEDEWNNFKEAEDTLIKNMANSQTVVSKFSVDKMLNMDDSNTNKCKDILCVYRKHFIESLPYNDNLGILCGMWAVPILLHKVSPTGSRLKESGSRSVNPKTTVQELEKPQIITDIPIEKFKNYLTTLLQNWTNPQSKYNVNISNVKVNDIPTIGDFRLTRSTIYININGESLPYIDVWNNTSYELIPYVYINFLKSKIKIAHPYVLARLLLVDHWVLHILSQSYKVKQAKERLQTIIAVVLYMYQTDLIKLYDIRTHSNYEGVWIEEKIAKKLKQLELK